jgi:K+-sensing histidine kinase KdpD
VVRKVLEKKELHIAPDTTKEGELLNGPFAQREGIKSAVAIPLIVDNRKVGVMFVNYHTPHLFNEDELTDIKLFAHQAAVAVRNGQMYEELKRNKKTIAARSALAWTGMASSTWLHETKGHAINIKDLQTLIRRHLSADVLVNVDSDLNTIEEMADKIINEAVTAPLQSEEGMKSLPINNFLCERFKQLKEPGSRHRQIWASFDFGLDENATARVNPDWLNRALEVLVDNADEAMAHLAKRPLAVKTCLVDNSFAHIEITDYGSGMEDEVWDLLLEYPIEHPKGDKRTGLGLLMAQLILQTYGGDILKGSTMVIRLPLEKQNGIEGGENEQHG